MQSNKWYPWMALPRATFPLSLRQSSATFDDLFDMPDGSTLTVAEVDPADGSLHAASWRDSGSTGFYPASTIKWITAALAVEWMDRHALSPDTVIAVGDDAPGTMRDLILSCLVMSDNDAFNTLQEAVGFAETHAAMRNWGVEHGLIRRHFTRPHWNHSRVVHVLPPDGEPSTIAARPAADIPLNDDPRPAPLGNPEANYFTADDFVITSAATLMGPTRDATHFWLLTQGLAWTNQNYVRQGLTRLTVELPDRPPFVVLSKPGWWPGDGANSEAAYIYDVAADRHYFLSVYVQGTNEEAQIHMADATHKLFAQLHAQNLLLID